MWELHSGDYNYLDFFVYVDYIVMAVQGSVLYTHAPCNFSWVHGHLDLGLT